MSYYEFADGDFFVHIEWKHPELRGVPKVDASIEGHNIVIEPNPFFQNLFNVYYGDGFIAQYMYDGNGQIEWNYSFELPRDSSLFARVNRSLPAIFRQIELCRGCDIALNSFELSGVVEPYRDADVDVSMSKRTKC